MLGQQGNLSQDHRASAAVLVEEPSYVSVACPEGYAPLLMPITQCSGRFWHDLERLSANGKSAHRTSWVTYKADPLLEERFVEAGDVYLTPVLRERNAHNLDEGGLGAEKVEIRSREDAQETKDVQRGVEEVCQLAAMVRGPEGC